MWGGWSRRVHPVLLGPIGDTSRVTMSTEWRTWWRWCVLQGHSTTPKLQFPRRFYQGQTKIRFSLCHSVGIGKVWPCRGARFIVHLHTMMWSQVERESNCRRNVAEKHFAFCRKSINGIEFASLSGDWMTDSLTDSLTDLLTDSLDGWMTLWQLLCTFNVFAQFLKGSVVDGQILKSILLNFNQLIPNSQSQTSEITIKIRRTKIIIIQDVTIPWDTSPTCVCMCGFSGPELTFPIRKFYDTYSEAI